MKKIYYKLILLFTLLIIPQYKADTLYCDYLSTDNKSEVKVSIRSNTNGYFNVWETDAKDKDNVTAVYIKWDGNQTTSVKHYNKIENFEENFWDLWIYKKQKCPDYLVASYKFVTGSDKHYDPYFTLSSTPSVNQNWGGYSTYKVLKNNPSGSTVNATTIKSLMAPRTPEEYGLTAMKSEIMYSHSMGTSFDSNASLNQDSIKQFSIKNGETIKFYGVIYTEPWLFDSRRTIDFSDKKITCQADKGSAVEIGSVSLIQWNNTVTNWNIMNPGFTFEVKAKQTSNIVRISCSVTKDGKAVVATNTLNDIMLEITQGDAPVATNDVQLKDAICYYTLQMPDKNGNIYDISDVKIELLGYNDAKGSVNDMGGTIKYAETGKKTSWKTATTNTVYKDYLYSNEEINKNIGLKFTFTITGFGGAMRDANGSCPTLYTKKSGSNYLVYSQYDEFDTDRYGAFTSKMERKKGGSDVYIPETYSRTQKTITIPVYFYRKDDLNSVTPADSFVDGGVTFFYEGGNLKYYGKLVETKSNGTLQEHKIEQSVINSPNSDIEIDTGVAYAINGKSYEGIIKVKSSFLQNADKYLKGTSGSYGTYNILSDRVPRGTGMMHNEYFIISAKEIVPESTLGQNQSTETNDVIEGTLENDGLLDELNRRKYGNSETQELEIFNNVNNDSNKNVCDVYFGAPGSRNSLYSIIHTLILAIRIAAPILLILMTSIDLAKATAIGEDAIQKSKKHGVTRIIVAIVIMLLPSLINILFDLAALPSCSIF